MSRGLFIFLSCLVAILAVVCNLLAAALLHVMYQQQPTTSSVSLLCSGVNLTAANEALEKAVFPIPVSPLCATRPFCCICMTAEDCLPPLSSLVTFIRQSLAS